jgi:hypothetical protein
MLSLSNATGRRQTETPFDHQYRLYIRSNHLSCDLEPPRCSPEREIESRHFGSGAGPLKLTIAPSLFISHNDDPSRLDYATRKALIRRFIFACRHKTRSGSCIPAPHQWILKEAPDAPSLRCRPLWHRRSTTSEFGKVC